MLSTASFALAHETGEPHEEPVLPPVPPKPLDLIRRAQEARQNINANTLEAKKELRADTRIQINTASGTGERKEILKGTIQERATIARDRIASTTALRSKIKESVRMHGGQIRERLTNAVEHLTKLMARIETRIEKMKTAGIEVSAVEALQVNASTAIATAEADIASVRSYMDSVTDESDRATVKAELEARIKKARASIQGAHEAVRKLVKALVDLAKANKPAASTSDTEAVTSE